MNKIFSIWKGIASVKGIRLLKQEIDKNSRWSYEDSDSDIVVYSLDKECTEEIKEILISYKLRQFCIW